MTKKRVIKLIMSRGYSRNRAREFQHIRSGKFTNEGIRRSVSRSFPHSVRGAYE